jgi:hypothetical protein
MIRYDLVCDKGHAFDGWFRDSATYDKQARRGFVSCSVCGSSSIEKQLMAPGIPVKSNGRAEAPQKMVSGPVDPRMAMMMKMMREMRQHVEQNADYVGDRFAEEARKIHFAETEARGIFGEATPDETKALLEDGIEIYPLPRLPEDSN